ncbi:ABC transporter substrate-binding protein [Phycicoccus ginsengisoli]
MPRVRLPYRRPLVAGVLVLATALSAGCSPRDAQPRDKGSAPRGELTVLSLGPVATWDPQRMAIASDAAFAGRVFLRTLTAFPPGADAAAQRSVVGDLATDLGTPDKDHRVWSYTLRDDARWQDGSPVTCEDVRYGVSRSFADPMATEGLNYPAAYLDLPRKPDGTPGYAGPWAKDAKGQAAYDKAVSCKGSTITFRLAAPMVEFDQVVASPAFAPVKKDQDKGPQQGTYAVFSSGPYRLKGDWDPNAGGTFVRNPEWDRASDPVRKGLPDTISYVEGTESQAAVQQVLADDPQHRQTVTLDPAPPAMQQNILSDSGLRARSLNPSGQFVDYLAPNLAKGVMRDQRVRTALALATNREGYVTALGGESAATPAFSLIGPALPGHSDADPTGAGPGGDPAAARAALEQAGLTLPVRIRVAYRSSPTADKAMAALSNGWTDGGFEVTLQPIEKDYFTAISAPGREDKTDVFWANWAASWPSASTVIPPLLDSRLNLLGDSSGRDYGRFADDKVNAEITRIGGIADATGRAAAWARLDASLAQRGAFVALAQRRNLYVAGSDVTGFAANEALGGFVDLAGTGVGG